MNEEEFRREVEKRLRQEQIERRNRRIRQQKKKKRRKIIIVVACIAAAAAVTVGVVAANTLGKAKTALDSVNRIETTVSESDFSKKLNSEIVNILLYGQDARDTDEEEQRSDSIIVASLDKKNNRIALISIMRDTYVPIEGYGSNKINAAFQYGGVDLLDKTITNNFGVKFEGNIGVDLEGFIEAIRPLCPIEIELTAEEAEYLNENEGYGSADDEAYEDWDLHEGTNSMTAEQLLAYSRIRYVGNSDWDRTARQRTVIMKAFEKIKSAGVTKALEVCTYVAPYITTDCSNSELLEIAKAVSDSNMNIESYRIPVEGTYTIDTIDGMSVLVPDLDANKRYMQGYINGTITEDEATTTYNGNNYNSGGDDYYYDNNDYYYDYNDDYYYDDGYYDNDYYDDGYDY